MLEIPPTYNTIFTFLLTTQSSTKFDMMALIMIYPSERIVKVLRFGSNRYESKRNSGKEIWDEVCYPDS